MGRTRRDRAQRERPRRAFRQGRRDPTALHPAPDPRVDRHAERAQGVFDSKQSVCTNLVITHRDGFTIDLETTPARHGWMYATDGILVHTNHFIAFVPEQIAATYRPFSVNSLWRLDRLQRGLQAVRDARGAEGVRDAIAAALRDHFGHPNSLCKHDDERLGAGDRYRTIASTIVDLTTGDYWFTVGPPCERDYRRIWNLYSETITPTRPVATAGRA